MAKCPVCRQPLPEALDMEELQSRLEGITARARPKKSRRSKPNSASVYLDCSKRKENVLGGQRSKKSSRSCLTQNGARTRPNVIRPVKFRGYGKTQNEQQTDERRWPRSR